MLLPGGYSLAQAYRSDTANGNAIGAFSAALRAAHWFEERGDFRNAGVWHREVYYANYLIWMEVGRSDFCRECGFSYSDLEREEKAYLAVAEANCRYRAPARYDDEILVETEITRLDRRVLEFSYRIKNGATLLAEGRTLHVIIGPDGKP